MHKIPIRLANFEWVNPSKPCGVIYQPVNMPKVLLHLKKKILDFGDALKVGAEKLGVATFRGSGPGFGLRTVIMDRNVRALAG